MILRLARRVFVKRKTKSQDDHASKSARPEKTKDGVVAVARKPEWVEVLTQSLKENALAPSDETILHAFDLYCDELNAPLLERRRAMSGRFSNIIAGFAKLQALAPDMVERAAAKHRLELNHFTDPKDDI